MKKLLLMALMVSSSFADMYVVNYASTTTADTSTKKSFVSPQRSITGVCWAKAEQTYVVPSKHKLKGKNVKVTIIGYTDNVEASSRKSRFNQKLALSRAKVVKNFIVRYFGVKVSDITVSGKPLCCYVTSIVSLILNELYLFHIILSCIYIKVILCAIW